MPGIEETPSAVAGVGGAEGGGGDESCRGGGGIR